MAAVHEARFWLKVYLPTVSSWKMGFVRDVPAASSDFLNPGAALMNALFIEPTKSPNGGTAVPMLRNHSPVPEAKSAKAGEPRYKFTVRL